MSWFKIDDAFHSSKPVKKIPRKYRAAAIGLWTIAGSWCAQEEEDGFVPEWMLEELCGTTALAAQLVRAGLWTVVKPGVLPSSSDAPTGVLPSSSESGEPGWQFKNWGKYNPTRAELEEKREKERIRKANYRMSQRDTNGTPQGQTEGHQQESTPSRPDPARPDPLTTANAVVDDSSSNAEAETSTEAPKQYAPEVHELCHHLAGWIVRNGNRTPTVGAQWLQACDRLIRLDGVRPDQIRAAIDWCQQDPFWQGNILSMPKLREKYDQLRAAAQRPTQQQHGGQPRPSATQTRLTTGQTMVERLKAKEEQRAQAEQAPLLQIGETA